ncbi:hypothetical protein [Dickeya chrysanthemi]|uniref:hypothetical protein n=1 Tax=Dickeya chrysanthemi TaxID=556 RepID=UPI0003A43F8F|nr:hypothetical protein [Dickeya chrysanthemi]MBX9447171.1 cell envelope biogenesis protein TolA [Dickeya chrysanthemi]MCA7007795.1 cell envelope biogenesis protein TolA [Dickeya chrysanthemi]
MTSPISFNRTVAGSSAPYAGTDSDAGTAQAGTEADTSREQQSFTSVLVQFSDEVRKRIDAAMRVNMSKLDNADQDLARGRIEQIKRRIQMLKMMLLSLAGQAVPPGIMREIRQLARELGQAANTLNEGGGGGMAAAVTAGGAGGENASGVAAENDGDTSGLSGAMADAAVSDNTSAGFDRGEDAGGAASAAKNGEDASAQEAEHWQNVAAALSERGSGTSQRREDAKSVQDAVRELKSLLAMVKNAVRNGDQEAQKYMQAINQALADTEKTAQEMSMTQGGADISIDLTANAAGQISIDVQV